MAHEGGHTIDETIGKPRLLRRSLRMRSLRAALVQVEEELQIASAAIEAELKAEYADAQLEAAMPHAGSFLSVTDESKASLTVPIRRDTVRQARYAELVVPLLLYPAWRISPEALHSTAYCRD
eukprot:CAMPEP_0174746608 /NCGR_PEP_ID=MMETSP1094-20130205/89436_1 /TAXON_ID=156173 /ORGANISM="Chrysochromulina brevifilum, Strain UTEX LB 985" /LENGTH=122 /DNA_ID=CAMNT_0015951349 /DNA_START=30 /DNA_END=396 /DNA_ORIENTATION=-